MASCYAAAAKSPQSCSTLCDPIDGSPPGSPVPGILQARTLEWVVIFFSSAWKWKVKVKSLSHVWLFWDTMDCSPPGYSVHGIFQARVLEWGAMMLCYMLATCIFFLWILCFEELSRLAQTALVHSFSCLEQHFSHFNKHNSHQGILLKYRF